jgi:hypothetical protein
VEQSNWGQPLDPEDYAAQRMVYVHKAASPQTVKIIKNIMRCGGVHRFAPDFLNPPNAPSNQLLWDSAVKAFTELVQCGEYEVDPQLQDPQIISQELRKYVKEVLSRR